MIQRPYSSEKLPKKLHGARVWPKSYPSLQISVKQGIHSLTSQGGPVIFSLNIALIVSQVQCAQFRNGDNNLEEI